MGNDSFDDAVVVSPEWEVRSDTPAPPAPGTQNPASTRLAIAVLLSIVGGLLLAARSATDEDINPAVAQAVASSVPETSSTTTTLPSAPRTRAIAKFDGQVLGVDVGASLVSTDFDGRLFALDLDSGVLTRSRIRTGNFVTVAGNLAVQTGCGGWQLIDVPAFAEGRQLIECGSYLPVGQLGAEALLFADPDAGMSDVILVDDGNGGLAGVELPNDQASAIATVSSGRVLVERGDTELLWIDPDGAEATSYAEGQLLAAGPGGVLWTDVCSSDGSCRVWFGSPDDAQIHQFVVEPFAMNRPARINPEGSRAVFFKADGILRIVTTETGHARELDNPGLTAEGATWSPDGLWLLQTAGADVVALNTLNGRSVEFEGVPGDFSPGWIALPITN